MACWGCVDTACCGADITCGCVDTAKCAASGSGEARGNRAGFRFESFSSECTGDEVGLLAPAAAEYSALLHAVAGRGSACSSAVGITTLEGWGNAETAPSAVGATRDGEKKWSPRGCKWTSQKDSIPPLVGKTASVPTGGLL